MICFGDVCLVRTCSDSMASKGTVMFTPKGPVQKYPKYTSMANISADKAPPSESSDQVSFATVAVVAQSALLSTSVFSMALALMLSRSGVVTYNNSATDNGIFSFGNLLVFVAIAVLFIGILLLFCAKSGTKQVPLWTSLISVAVAVSLLVIATTLLQGPETSPTIQSTSESSSFILLNFGIASFVVVMGFGLLFVYFMQSTSKAYGWWAAVFASYVALYAILSAIFTLLSTRTIIEYTPAPPPPAPPGMYYNGVVTFAAMVSGSVDSFNEPAYKTGVAGLLPGIYEGDIGLNVTAGSVRVETTITTTNLTAAEDAYQSLRAYNSSFMTAALNMTVEWFGDVMYTSMLAGESGSGWDDYASGNNATGGDAGSGSGTL